MLVCGKTFWGEVLSGKDDWHGLRPGLWRITENVLSHKEIGDWRPGVS